MIWFANYVDVYQIIFYIAFSACDLRSGTFGVFFDQQRDSLLKGQASEFARCSNCFIPDPTLFIRPPRVWGTTGSLSLVDEAYLEWSGMKTVSPWYETFLLDNTRKFHNRWYLHFGCLELSIPHETALNSPSFDTKIRFKLYLD